MQLSSNQRKCTASERKLLSRHRSELIKAKRQQRKKVILTSLSIFGTLALLSCLSNPGDAIVIIAFWLIVGIVISLWIYIPGQRGLSKSIERYDLAIDSSMADDSPIVSKRYWEIEEREDEGACYAFELLSRQVVFLSGQEYYANRKFPSLDFSLVAIKDNHGDEVEMLIQSRGPKVPPEKKLDAIIKSEYNIPDHGTIIDGTLEEVFEKIKRPS
jgi:hypothetical protein